MRVFILSTGRSGSKSFIKACNHINNYTAAHESLAKKIGPDRFDYPDSHIEADNRLSWFLGSLDKKFGNEAFYVHLKRNKKDTANSYVKRWTYQGNILKAFSEGILLQGYKKHSDEEKLIITENFIQTVEDNISAFLKDKPNKMVMNLENITEDFAHFYEAINAKGNLEEAIISFNTPNNTCLLYTSPSPRDQRGSRMPSSA